MEQNGVALLRAEDFPISVCLMTHTAMTSLVEGIGGAII